MEWCVLPAGSAQISFTDSRKYFGAIIRVQFPSAISQRTELQCSKLSPRCRRRSVNVHTKRTGACALGAPDCITRELEVVLRSVRLCKKSVCRFEPHGYCSKVAFGTPQDTNRRYSREFELSRSIVTCSFISAAYDSKVEVLPRNQHFKRVEEFYDANGFLFAEDSWDLDTGVSSLWKDRVSTLLTAARVEDGSTVLSWGGGSELIRQLSVRCPGSLVVCHFSLSLLALAKESNDDIVCWHGDIVDIASCSYGPFDSVFLNILPALSVSPVQLLQVVAGLCKFGARIVISSSQGKRSLAVHRESNPGIVLHDLPDFTSLETMIAGLPLKIVEFQDDSSYLATLKVTQEASLLPSLNVKADSSAAANTSEIRTGNRTFKLVPNYPLRVRGRIVKGFGRGSKQMGIPTANVDPEGVPEDVLLLPKGVYCGWAQVHGRGLDGGVYKMAMNIGNRPTFADGGGVSVEVHILHDYGNVDFYGERLSFLVLGFIREEMQFKSLGELVQRIQTDLEIARKGLDEEEMQQFAADELFLSR